MDKLTERNLCKTKSKMKITNKAVVSICILPVTVCECHIEIKDYILTYLLTYLLMFLKSNRVIKFRLSVAV